MAAAPGSGGRDIILLQVAPGREWPNKKEMMKVSNYCDVRSRKNNAVIYTVWEEPR